MEDAENYVDPLNDALDRMKRAHERGTGCHLTREMIEALYVSILGSIWEEPRP